MEHIQLLHNSTISHRDLKQHSGRIPAHHPHKSSHHLHSGRLRRHHLRDTAANLLANPTSKWILLVVVAIVVFAGSGIGLIVAHLPGPPVLSLSGGSSVTSGSALSVHGQRLFAGRNCNIFSRSGFVFSYLTIVLL